MRLAETPGLDASQWKIGVFRLKQTFVKIGFYGVPDVDVAAPRLPVSPRVADQLYRLADLSHLEFSSTAELRPIDKPAMWAASKIVTNDRHAGGLDLVGW